MSPGITFTKGALKCLDELLNSASKTRRMAAAFGFGRMQQLPRRQGSQLRELETKKKGTYALRVDSTPGSEIVLFFTASGAAGRLSFRIVHVAEVMGPSQFDVELAFAQTCNE